jgi:hypothetical protein
MSLTGNVFGVNGKKCTSFLVGDVIGVVCNAHATNSTERGALGEGVAATEDRRQRTENR